ncbi:MAG TPA: gliding motility-associated protein GldE [Prolixibacteraceae bacterium]|nr:gliding motility-associated protein GldE [Prolixibacteraceae bacterium]
METDSIAQTRDLLASVGVFPAPAGIIISIVILFVLLLFSGLVSGAELAFFSLSASDKEFIEDSKRKSHQFIRKLLRVPDKLLATILVSNIFINVGIVILSAYLLNSTFNFAEAGTIGYIIQIAVISFLILLFGEVLPKTYASNFSKSFAEKIACPLYYTMKLLSPLVWIITKSTFSIDKRIAKHNKNLSIDDISQALELTSDEELSDEKEILEGIVKFGTTSVYQIMTPRIDVVAIENDCSAEKLINTINHSGYSRIPVYNETFDNIDGILYIKDLLPHLNKLESFRWQSLVRAPYYIPENKKIDDLLKEFQKTKVHMAIVVDEYGGTSGIITLEDIMEEIVGDIIDEFDDDDRLFSKINDTSYIFDGKTQLNDFYRICDLDDNFLDEVKGEADTLAGLVLELKNDFPKVNEKLSFKHIDFIVEALDKRRIKKIKVVFNIPVE